MKLKEKFACLSDHTVSGFVYLQVFFNAMLTILTLFVNTFLLKAYGTTSSEVMTYNLILAATQPLAMCTSFFISKKLGYINTQRIGFGFYVLVLVVMSVLGEGVAFLYPLFAVAISFGAGYYYAIYSIQMLYYTNDKNRDAISGVLTMLGTVISLVLPILSGWLITAFNEFIGYKIVFALVMLVAVAAIIVTRRLPDIELRENERGFVEVLRVVLKNKNGRRIMLANLLDNCRSFTIGLFITVLVYRLLESEMLVSIGAALGSIAAIIGAAIYGAAVSHKRRIGAIFLASIATLLACCTLWLKLDAIMIIMFYVVYSFFNIFITMPILNTHFGVMEHELGLKDSGAQAHTVREFFVAVGRGLGIAMILLIPQSDFGVVLSLGILVATSLISVWLMRSIEKNGSKQTEDI